MSINIHEAKTHFSRILKRVAMGEEIISQRRESLSRKCHLTLKVKETEFLGRTVDYLQFRKNSMHPSRTMFWRSSTNDSAPRHTLLALVAD